MSLHAHEESSRGAVFRMSRFHEEEAAPRPRRCRRGRVRADVAPRP